MEKNTQTPEKKPAPATFTARIDRPSYERLQAESEERNIPLSTYAASMIKECWTLRARAETMKPETKQSEVNPVLPDEKQPDAVPAPNAPDDTNYQQPAPVWTAPTKAAGALVWLQKRYPQLSEADLIAAALINVYDNERTWLFLDEFKKTVKKHFPTHEA